MLVPLIILKLTLRRGLLRAMQTTSDPNFVAGSDSEIGSGIDYVGSGSELAYASGGGYDDWKVPGKSASDPSLTIVGGGLGAGGEGSADETPGKGVGDRPPTGWTSDPTFALMRSDTKNVTRKKTKKVKRKKKAQLARSASDNEISRRARQFVEPALVVADTLDPPFRRLSKIEYNKDFKVTSSKNAIVQFDPVVHEPYQDPAKLNKHTSWHGTLQAARPRSGSGSIKARGKPKSNHEARRALSGMTPPRLVKSVNTPTRRLNGGGNKNSTSLTPDSAIASRPSKGAVGGSSNGGEGALTVVASKSPEGVGDSSSKRNLEVPDKEEETCSTDVGFEVDGKTLFRRMVAASKPAAALILESEPEHSPELVRVSQTLTPNKPLAPVPTPRPRALPNSSTIAEPIAAPRWNGAPAQDVSSPVTLPVPSARSAPAGLVDRAHSLTIDRKVLSPTEESLPHLPAENALTHIATGVTFAELTATVAGAAAEGQRAIVMIDELVGDGTRLLACASAVDHSSDLTAAAVPDSVMLDGIQAGLDEARPQLVMDSMEAWIPSADEGETDQVPAKHWLQTRAEAVGRAVTTLEKARLAAEQRRDAALLQALGVSTRTVTVSKAVQKAPIGLELATDHTESFLLTVVAKCEPWQLCGIEVGDAVVAVNGISSLCLSHCELVEKLSHAHGFITLTVCRAGTLRAAIEDAHFGPR